MKFLSTLSVLLVLSVLAAAQFGPQGGFPGQGGPQFGPQGGFPGQGGPQFGPQGGFPGQGGSDFGGPSFGGGQGFGPNGNFQDAGAEFNQVGVAQIAPGVEVNFGGQGSAGFGGPSRMMPNFEHIDEDEMVLGFLSPILFSKLGDPEDTLGDLCPDIDAIGVRARELLADADFTDACAEVEFSVDMCSDAAEQCEGFKFAGPRGPSGEAVTCPVDESQLVQACKDRFEKQQENGQAQAQQQCDRAWSSQGAGLQQRCQQQDFQEQYRDFKPEFEQKRFDEFNQGERERFNRPHGEFDQRQFPGQNPQGGFPGQSDQFPGGQDGRFPGQPGQFPGQQSGQQPPGGEFPQPPAGGFPQGSSGPMTPQQPPAGSAPSEPAPQSPPPQSSPPAGGAPPGATQSAGRITGLQVGVGFPGQGGPDFGGPQFGPPGGFGGGPQFGPQGSGDFGGSQFGSQGSGGSFGSPMGGGPDFCNEEGFKQNCLQGFGKFKEENEQRMDQMCNFEAKMMKRGLNMYCKQKERFGDPYDRCVQQTTKGCDKMKQVVTKCKAAANLDGAVELIKKKAKVECARMGLKDKKSRYADAVSILESLEVEGQTREDAIQLAATRDKIVLSAEELEKIKADVKADVIKDIMTLLGLNSGQFKEAAEKQREQVASLKGAYDGMSEICEKVEGDAKEKCDAQLEKMSADIKAADDEATSFESRAGGILGVLGGIAGGN